MRNLNPAHFTRFAARALALVLTLAGLQACTAPSPSVPIARAAAPVAATGVQRLYIINCGEGIAGDISRWSPGVNEGKSMAFVDSCYLIRHAQGWLLWDTGVSDAVAAMPDGLRPTDARMTTWRRPRTLAAQLAEIGVQPTDIRYVAVSHSHPDHIGNVTMFPRATLLAQKAEYEWPQASGPRFAPDMQVDKLEGDRDVFGDGSVVLLSTPGHTPGHQSLLVRLAHTGVLVLSGDAAHFKDNWEARRVPLANVDAAQTVASMQRLADILKRENATLWINHDKAQRDGLKLAPAFYD
jgi:glyoxylase-like metal-dependent hydrolase (beta-lactamase superfamily II)